MKAKTIKLVLRQKIDDWIANIKDEVLRDLAKRDTIVTGGCIASMLLGEKVNDFDIYFRTRETTLRMVNYYVDAFKADPPKGLQGEDGGIKVPISAPFGVLCTALDGKQAQDFFLICQMVCVHVYSFSSHMSLEGN